MNKKLLAAMVIGTAGLAWAAPQARADVITIGTALNGGTPTVVATGTGTASYSGSLGNFTIAPAGGTGAPPLTNPALLDSDTIDITSTATTDTLDVYVTESDITSPTGLESFLSSFTENTMTAGWTVTESVYLDTADGIFALTTLLGTTTITAGLTTDEQTIAADVGDGPYSITAMYVINTNDTPGQDNSTINVAVPEPGSLLVLGTGLFAFGMVGWTRRRRGV
jgi:hypothetical protein